MKKAMIALVPVFLLLLAGCGLLAKPPAPADTPQPASAPVEETASSAPNTPAPESDVPRTPAPDAKVYPDGNSDAAGSQTDNPSPEPSPTPSPDPSPEPSPTPEAPPLPEGDVLCSGRMRSDTETALNLLADWYITESADGYLLTVQLSLESYSLSVGERTANTVTVNGIAHSFYSPALEIEGGGLAKTWLYTYSEALSELPEQLNLQAVWELRGSYSGKDLPAVELSGTATLH